MRLFRWKAIVPMVLAAVIIVVAWMLLIDHAIRRAIEVVGTELVGAKVELSSARLRLTHADLVLRGLRVTDPNAPMTNLVEVAEMVANLNGRALLAKKAVVETLAVRGVRFGTPRTTSGAVSKQGSQAASVTRRITDWAGSIPLPTLDLSGLVGTVVKVGAVNADSLRTLRLARSLQASGDSARGGWEARLRSLDPAPTLDSARALAEQLRGIDLRRTNPVQLASTVNRARQVIGRVTSARDSVGRLKTDVDSGLATLRRSAQGLAEARSADYAYARGLLNVPTLGGPDISMAMFGRVLTDRIKPVLYWVNLAEQYIPPGLDPRRQRGPKRARMAGTTFRFPLLHTWPTFLVEHADADLAIGGRTVAAGSYWARASGVTTEPAVYGRPLTFGAGRRSEVGPSDLSVGGSIDRVGAVPRDSLSALVGGVTLPAIPIPQARANLDLGPSTIGLNLRRSGSEIEGTYRITSQAVRWLREGDTTSVATQPRIGTKEWAEGLLWRSISSVPSVTLEGRISGQLTSPRLAVSSNIGDAVSANLRSVLGAEMDRAEREARAQVDRLVNEQVGRVQSGLASLQTQVAEKLGLQQQQLEQVRVEIDQQVRRLTPSSLPGGLRIPGRP